VKRVLIAEDDPDTAAAIKETLEDRLHVNTEHVTNGALVFDRFAADRPDLLVLDVYLPGLNGLDVFDLIRGSGRSPDVPILFLTSAPDRAEQAYARTGISVVMRKPFDVDALAQRVAELLTHAEKAA
jgi:two-component system, OmpR family, response regulator ResD